MVGLGTVFIAIMGVSAFLLGREGSLFDARWMLWILLLSRFRSLHCHHCRLDDGGARPAALAGSLWIDAHRRWLFEAGLGRQRRMFTLLGFMGMYLVMGVLFLFLIHREIERGPVADSAAAH